MEKNKVEKTIQGKDGEKKGNFKLVEQGRPS